MTDRKRLVILAVVALAVIATFMLKNRDETTFVSEKKDLPVLLDLSMET